MMKYECRECHTIQLLSPYDNKIEDCKCGKNDFKIGYEVYIPFDEKAKEVTKEVLRKGFYDDEEKEASQYDIVRTWGAFVEKLVTEDLEFFLEEDCSIGNGNHILDVFAEENFQALKRIK